MAIVAPFDGWMVYRVGTNLMPGGLSADAGDYRILYYEREGVGACGVKVGFYIYNFPSILSEDVVLFPTKLNGAKEDAAPINKDALPTIIIAP